MQTLLTKNKIDINKSNQKGDTALMSAVENNRLEVVQALLAQNKIDVNFTNKNGEKALDLAANKGHYEIVKTLIAHGANFNMEKNWFTKALFMELSPQELLKIGGMHSKSYNNEVIRKEWKQKWNLKPQEMIEPVSNKIMKIEPSLNNSVTTKVVAANSNNQQPDKKMINIENINNENEQLILQKMAACPNVPTNFLINENQKSSLKKAMMTI